MISEQSGRGCTMGGSGSGNFYHWWRPPRKATVEECLTLSTSFLTRNRYLEVGVRTSGSVQWGKDSGAPWVSLTADTRDIDRPSVTLTYRVGKDPGPGLEYTIP